MTSKKVKIVEPLLGDTDVEIEAAPPPSDVALGQVAALAQRVLMLQDAVQEATAALERKQKELSQASDVDLPELMTRLGLTQFRLRDGAAVELVTAYHASIPKARAPEAMAWFETNGHGSLVKHEIKVEFAKGEEKFFQKFLRDLKKRKKPVKAAARDYVAPQTLGAFVREQIAAGVSIPMELLGVFVRRYATVTPSAAKPQA